MKAILKYLFLFVIANATINLFALTNIHNPLHKIEMGYLGPFQLNMNLPSVLQLIGKRDYKLKEKKELKELSIQIEDKIYNLNFKKDALQKIILLPKIEKDIKEKNNNSRFLENLKAKIQRKLGRPFSSRAMMTFSDGKIIASKRKGYLGKFFILYLNTKEIKEQSKIQRKWNITITLTKVNGKNQKPPATEKGRKKEKPFYGKGPLRGI